jgi:hypothetical protein
MAKPKLLLIYLFLVGFPLLGLLAILRTGERLTPPQSLGGAWKLEADFTSLASKACQDLLLDVKQPFLIISQSGPALALTLNNSRQTTLPGTVQNARIAAGISRPAAVAAECSNPEAIRLEADIAREAGQRILVGALSIAGCSDCAPIPFRARRQSPPHSEGR